jgi:hypothetical protein
VSTHEDCAYWDLDLIECCRYHGRLAQHASRRCAWHADQARRAADTVERWLKVSAAAWLLATVLLILGYSVSP